MSKLTEKQFEFSKNLCILVEYIFAKGFYCSLGEVYRPPETAKLYAEKGIGISNSLHCIRLAVDLNIFSRNKEWLTKSEQYKFAGDFWETLHPDNKWGGRFGDGNHFEMKSL